MAYVIVSLLVVMDPASLAAEHGAGRTCLVFRLLAGIADDCLPALERDRRHAGHFVASSGQADRVSRGPCAVGFREDVPAAASTAHSQPDLVGMIPGGLHRQLAMTGLAQVFAV